MAIELNLQEQELLAGTFELRASLMTPSERRAEVSLAFVFAVVVFGLWMLDPPHAVADVTAAMCLAVLAVATRVRFDMPFGFTVPTQLAFVPLLFAVPVVLVPIGVVVALLAASLPDVFRGRCKPSRLLLMVGNSWFAIGPVAVFALSRTDPRHAGAALLVAALAAQFAVDFAASTLRNGLGRGAGLSEQLRESWVYAIDLGLSGMGLVVAVEIHTHPVAALAPLPLLAILAVLGRERHQRLEGLLELNNAYRGTALVLGDVVEADDGYTGMHCKSVVALALEVGQAMGLNAERRRDLEFAALLHDVGKIAIPKEIINKPGKLDPDEWVLVQTHTIEGQAMLDRVGGFMREVGLIVRSHHERWDGGGYPDGLAGEAIRLEARIITVCDSWNAMRTDRSYRQALPEEEALAELRANSGRQFDPGVVEVLVRIVAANAPAAAGVTTGQAKPQPGVSSPGSLSAGVS